MKCGVTKKPIIRSNRLSAANTHLFKIIKL